MRQVGQLCHGAVEANWQLWLQPVPMVPKVATSANGGKSGNGAKSAKISNFPSRPSLPWQHIGAVASIVVFSTNFVGKCYKVCRMPPY